VNFWTVIASARKLTSVVMDDVQLIARAAERLEEMFERNRAIDDGHTFRLSLPDATNRPAAR
jgi:hypothetical protein